MGRKERQILNIDGPQVIFSEIPKRFALVFSGQGSEFKGMGQTLSAYSAVQAIYEKAEEISGYPIRQISFEDQGYLSREIFARPAVFVHNHACLTVLKRKRGFKPDAVAGRGVGFYNALVAAGSITFEEGFKLVQMEAEGIDKAGEEHPGKMLTLSVESSKRKLLKDTVQALTERGFLIEAFNSENQIVVGVTDTVFSGDKDLQNLLKELENQGLKIEHHRGRAILHSPLMETAKELLRKNLGDNLEDIELKDAEIPVATTTYPPKFIIKSKDIRQEILDQITNPIQWEMTESLLEQQGIPLEVGGRAFLSNMAENNIARAAAGAVIGGVFVALAFTYKNREKK